MGVRPARLAGLASTAGVPGPPVAAGVVEAQAALEIALRLKALADPVRAQRMSLLLAGREDGVCTCDLAPAVGLSEATISHHLKVLHEAGLLDREKRGTWVFYLARPAAMAALANLFTSTEVPA